MTTKPKAKKTRIVKRHAKKRAMERFGLRLNTDEIQKIIGDIRNNRAEFVSRTSLTRTLWRVEIAGQKCIVVYDKNRKTLVTFLRDENQTPERTTSNAANNTSGD